MKRRNSLSPEAGTFFSTPGTFIQELFSPFSLNVADHSDVLQRNASCSRYGVTFSDTFFSWLGMMQRTKLGFVFLRVAMSLDSCSLYSWPTVRNMPLRVLKAPGISDMDTLSRPTIRSTERGEKRETTCETAARFQMNYLKIFNQANSNQTHVIKEE